MNQPARPASGQPGGLRQRSVRQGLGLGALLALCLASLLGGCSRENEAQQQAKVLLHSGVATGMRPNVLMDAAFGAENELIEPGAVYWQVVLPLPQPLTQAQYQEQIARAMAQDKAALASTSAITAGRVDNRLMAVRPREAVRLNDTQVALVVESIALSDLPARSRQQAASAPGVAVDAVAASDRLSAPQTEPVAQTVPMHLGVIFFQTENAVAQPANSPPEAGAETWRAARLVPHVDHWMTGPVPPEVQVYKLDASRYLVTYTQTDCRAGACSRWLKGYLLQPESMTAIFATRLAASNARQYADCPARLGLADSAAAADAVSAPAQVAASGLEATVASLHGYSSDAALPQPAAPQASAASALGEAASGHVCHVVDGEVHLISRGRADTADVHIRYTGVVSDAPGKLRTIAQTQRFRLKGMQLEQIAGGASPVPAHAP